MVESPVYGLLHAYALGCLNKNDFKDLKKYFRSGQPFEWAELGEYQNLGAMLPSILNIDSPPPQLKDKVARRLYRIREQRRKTLTDLHKITQLSTPAIIEDAIAAAKAAPIPVPPVPVAEEAPSVIADKGFARVTQEKVYDQIPPIPKDIHDELDISAIHNKEDETKKSFYQTQFEIDPAAINNWEEPEMPSLPIPEQVKPKATKEIPLPHKFTREMPPAAEQQPEKPAYHPPVQNPILERLSGGDYDLPSDEDKVIEKGRKGLWTAIVLLFILVLAICAGGYYLYTQNLKNSKDIERIRQQMNSQTFKADANSEIFAMINSREFKIAELKPVKETITGYGKIFMSFDLKTAYLQFAELPEPAEGKSYHLWAEISGNMMSLGEFTPKSSINYEPLPKLPVIDKDMNVSFLLTEEKAGDVKNPSNKIFLSGTI